MKINPSQQKVLDAASQLFFQKGFHGTSVRDIAEKADVNVSLISYYFKSKQGLLEYSVTHYYEAYLEIIEDTFERTKTTNRVERLKSFVADVLEYKQEHYQFSCFVHRELSLDSVFVREMAVTYLAKENHYLRDALFEALPQTSNSLDRDFLLMHLKGMLTTPYVLQNEWRDKVIGRSSHYLFQKKYVETVHAWIDFIVGNYYNKSDFDLNITLAP